MGYQVLPALSDPELTGYNPRWRGNLKSGAKLAYSIADTIKHNREVDREDKRRGVYRKAIQQELGLSDDYPIPQGQESELMGDAIKSRMSIAEYGAKEATKPQDYNDDFRMNFRKVAETVRAIKRDPSIPENKKAQAQQEIISLLRTRYPDKAQSIFFFDME
jgi:hypothetical protein